jgi:hypothetical protein
LSGKFLFPGSNAIERRRLMTERQLCGMLLLVFYFNASSLWAGPVNTPGSYPYAKASSRGDRLTLGDLKGLVYWQENGLERVAALAWNNQGSPSQRFTGGLAEAVSRLPGAPAALACNGDETQLFYPDRSSARPAGFWITADPMVPAEHGTRRCAMGKNGEFAEFFAAAAVLMINRQLRISIPSDFQDAELVAAGEGFLLLTSSKALSIYPKNQSWILSASWSHGFSNVSEETRWDGNAQRLLKADPDGNALAEVTQTADGPRTVHVQRLPVNPCDTGQACGLSLAEDDTWLISGYWGHYLGRGSQFMRLSIPLSVDEGSGAVAIAHTGDAGRYIYIGWDDGDQGVLPALPRLLHERSQRRDRYMVWTRAVDRSVSMQPWNGPLPEVIPEQWLAWEAGYDWTLQAVPSVRALADDRWWLERLGALPAQELLQKAGVKPRAIRAAVIDSGADPEHPWLKAQLDRKAGEIPDNGLDDDGNGYVDDVWGYDFVDEDAVPQDEYGHGSHVAGLMVGQKAGDIRNPAPNLLLTVVRALDRSGKSNSIDLARALFYAADNGAEMVNCSWGGGPDTQALRDAFAMLRERGILVFSSAGNDRLDTDKSPDVPKKYPAVIAVAASDRRNQLASFSSFGQKSVRFIAPGDEVVSTIPGGQWGEKSGTSMASPLAAASFALVWGAVAALHPELDKAAQIAKADRVLCATADGRGVEKRSQCGRIRLKESVESLLQLN